MGAAIGGVEPTVLGVHVISGGDVWESMTANADAALDAPEEAAETVRRLEERVERLERVVEAVGAAAGTGRSWMPCPECDDGVVVVGDRGARCTDCGYARPL